MCDEFKPESLIPLGMMSESAARRVFRAAVAGRRRTLGLSQRDLIARLAESGIQMHQSTLAKIEKGDREPKIDEIVAISAVLGLRLDEVLVPPDAQVKRDIASAQGFVRKARQHLSGAAMETAAIVAATRGTPAFENAVQDLLSDEFLAGLWEYKVLVPDKRTALLAEELIGRAAMNLVHVEDEGVVKVRERAAPDPSFVEELQGVDTIEPPEPQMQPDPDVSEQAERTADTRSHA